MIKLDNLIYRYGQQTMHFSFSAVMGEKIAILGPSGAGKSTLLSLIAGFIMADSGVIELNGQDCRQLTAAKRPVSMLFQENNLFAHLSVGQNIALGLNPGLRLTAEQREEMQLMAERVGLAELLNRLPGELSGGQRQRVALARCLVRRQPILLLDEPFSALDPALRYDMLSLVDWACRERQLTLLMVSHNLDDAARIAPRSLIVANGSLQYDGPTADLISGQSPAAHIIGVG